MKFGMLVAPSRDAPATVIQAESLGFESAFFVDSPAVFGDPYVSMAACAVQTSRILLATGVTNPLTRSAPVTACALASLNALAPGRIALGIGLGFTANLAMGYRNATLAEQERYVQNIRQLLHGEIADVALPEKDVLVQFLNPDGPWVNIQAPVPIIMAAAGPKNLRLAGRLADAIILGGITNGDIIDACRRHISEGAEAAGRDPGQIELAITPSVYVTDAEPSLEHLREVLGPKSLAPALNFSRMAELSGTAPADVVRDLVAVRGAYKPESDDDGDERTRHLRAYRGYMTELKDWQYDLVTRNLLGATSIAGTAEQCIEKIRSLQEHGIGRVILSPLPRFATQTMATYGRDIIPYLQ